MNGKSSWIASISETLLVSAAVLCFALPAHSQGQGQGQGRGQGQGGGAAATAEQVTLLPGENVERAAGRVENEDFIPYYSRREID